MVSHPLQADSLLNMLKANHYKLLCSHAEISQAPRPTSQFGDYIETITDKHVSSWVGVARNTVGIPPLIRPPLGPVRVS